MENAAKALEIAAGVLLALIIMSLIAYFFSTISILPQSEDEMQTAEQLAKFNLEYEVYNKSGMYGADVISCLAKAQSNNEKYVEGGSFLKGNTYGKEFLVNVYVKVNDELKEDLIIYYYAPNTITGRMEKTLLMGTASTGKKMGEVGFIFKTAASGDVYTRFNANSNLEPITHYLSGAGFIDTTTRINASNGSHLTAEEAEELGITVYNAQLYNPSDVDEVTPLQRLISFASTNMKQVVNNNTGEDLDKWCSAEWKTALYDFKTRKFKCDGIQYSETTGRVSAICFSEI